jgi:hypothetical protein
MLELPRHDAAGRFNIPAGTPAAGLPGIAYAL